MAGGVEHAFTVPGESFLPILDALYTAPIRTIATRHESGAAFAAEAVGQLTGRPAACLATRAVGAANMAIGLHTARADSTPLIAIVGQVPLPFRGREAFQEVDQVATFGRLCKAAIEVSDPNRLAEETARLLGVAREGRPGPVLLSLPEDVLEAEVASVDLAPSGAPDRPSARPGDIEAVLQALASAHSPVILAGAGVVRSGAVAELCALAERFVVPVIAAWRRQDVMDNAHPFYLGVSGLGAAPGVRERLLEADLLLVLGSRLNEIASFEYAVPGVGTRLIHVDIEAGFAGDRRPPDLAIRADLLNFLRAALEREGLVPADAAARRAGIDADRAAWVRATTIPTEPPGEPVDPAVAVRALRRVLPDDAIVTTDAGNFGGWYLRYLPIRAGQRFLGPTSGAMGYGLPAAIGAAVAEPGRPVVALAGDGGFAMLMAELETAVRERLRLAVLVHDNRMYGTIRMHQQRAHPGRVFATQLGALDVGAVAEACGARAIRASRDAEVEDAIAEAIRGDGVTVVHLRTDPRRLSVDLLLNEA